MSEKNKNPEKQSFMSKLIRFRTHIKRNLS